MSVFAQKKMCDYQRTSEHVVIQMAQGGRGGACPARRLVGASQILGHGRPRSVDLRDRLVRNLLWVIADTDRRPLSLLKGWQSHVVWPELQ